MPVAPVTVCSTVRAGLVAALGILSPPWQASMYPYDVFPGPNPEESLVFAVGLPGTEPNGPGRQSRVAGHVPVRSVVGIKISTFIRADNAIADYDTALTREALFVAALTALTGAPLALDGITRTMLRDQIFVADIRMIALHTYPL
jgi:hypothetical protein